MKKDKKPDTSAIIDNFNFCDIQTDTQTDGHGRHDRPSPEGRVGENHVSNVTSHMSHVTCQI